MVGRAMIEGRARYVRITGDVAEPLALDGMAPTGPLLESGGLWKASPDGQTQLLSDTEFLVPIVGTRKVVAIGLNYVDHAAEASQALPSDPLVFAKFSSAIIGPGDAISFDTSLTAGVDSEAELGVVIGRPTRRVTVDAALSHVGAYTCVNDVSARDLQFRDGQWVRGKSLDSFCPIGPWLVEPGDFGALGPQRIRGIVSGEVLQDAVVADMIFGVAELVSRLSASFTLEPGDVIATGTPPGVGWFREPRRVLRNGDIVEVSIEGIGSLVNLVRTD